MDETKAKLLIVDDEPDIREILKETMGSIEDLPLEIETAEDGQQALEKIRVTKYDAVLSDIRMPRMDGMELLTKIRGEGIFVPFVILTGHGDKALTVEALQKGAMDFLDKPWKVEVLEVTIKKAIEVGQELNRWGHQSAEAADIDNIRSENSVEAIERLTKVIAQLANENQGLKKKLEEK